jgi:hypothetical protein
MQHLGGSFKSMSQSQKLQGFQWIELNISYFGTWTLFFVCIWDKTFGPPPKQKKKKKLFALALHSTTSTSMVLKFYFIQHFCRLFFQPFEPFLL